METFYERANTFAKRDFFLHGDSKGLEFQIQWLYAELLYLICTTFISLFGEYLTECKEKQFLSLQCDVYSVISFETTDLYLQ
jgi:hypothetical protein